MYFLIENYDILEKYNTIWDKVSADIKKEFDSKPVYNENFLNKKIKSDGDEVADFYDKEIPRVDSNHMCFAVTRLDSTLKKDENYYLQLLLKKCKYIKKKKLAILMIIWVIFLLSFFLIGIHSMQS